jgi:hypothetical protein
VLALVVGGGGVVVLSILGVLAIGVADTHCTYVLYMAVHTCPFALQCSVSNPSSRSDDRDVVTDGCECNASAWGADPTRLSTTCPTPSHLFPTPGTNLLPRLSQVFAVMQERVLPWILFRYSYIF